MIVNFILVYLTKKNVFSYKMPALHPNFYPIAWFNFLAVEHSVVPDQLASEKPADQDLHCFQNKINLGSAF